MAMTLSVFLYIYYAFLIGWLMFSLAAIYHMLKFGFRNFITFFITFLYIAVSVIFLFLSYLYIRSIDWETEIILFSFIGGSLPF